MRLEESTETHCIRLQRQLDFFVINLLSSVIKCDIHFDGDETVYLQLANQDYTALAAFVAFIIVAKQPLKCMTE